MLRFDVAVIGGGVVGSLIARELSRYAVSVAVLEKGSDVALGASKANSGIVHAGFDAKEGSLKAKLNVQGNLMYESLCKDLGVKFQKTGALVVSFSKNDLGMLKELYERGLRNGVKELSLLNQKETLALEPNLSRDACGALLAGSSGITCPYEMTIAAMGNAMDNGAKLFLNFDVRKMSKEGEGFLINDSVFAKYVVNCAGVHSDDIARLLGDDSFLITPRRGEYLLMDKECGKFVSRTVFTVPTKMGKGILVSPTVDGNLLLGPTSENISNKLDSSTTAEGLEKVKLQAMKEFPDLAIRNVITSFTGLRSVGDTEDFIIRESKVKNFILACGIESPGLTAAPAIALYVLNLLKDCGLKTVEKKKFLKTRQPDNFFALLSQEQKNKLIATDKRFGRIVCRCEEVTEGEIVHAIHSNPPATSVDAVKRRTRGGMGRCQGGFCGPQVVEILARERNVDILKINKSMEGSYINCGRTK